MRTLLSLLNIWCLAVSTTALAKPKKENLAELPVEETCGREYARWEYLYLAGKIDSKAQDLDWPGAIEEAKVLKGVGLTCWEQYNLSMTMSAIHASNDQLEIANAYFAFIDGLSGLEAYQTDALLRAKEKLALGEWAFIPLTSDEEASRLVAENIPDRAAYPIKPPHTKSLINVMRRYGQGKAMCYVLFDVDVEGKPMNLYAKCSFDKFDKAAVKAVSRARFSPKIVNGEPAIHYGIQYPFELIIE